jgi:flagellar biosynthesis/type III secretory pathway protein FliH
MFHTISRPPVSLPRFSIAGLMLAFVLSATVATFVGVAAWSLGTSSGPTTADLASIRQAAYANGVTAGVQQGHAQAAIRARDHGYASGLKQGYRKGLKAGLHKGKLAGMTAGRSSGYTSGYTAGYRAGQAAGRTHKKH